MVFLKRKRRSRAAPSQTDELAEKLSKDVALPRGLRLRVVDERVLTEEGKRATKKGVLVLDEVAS